ncbi:hypothetical protein SYNPS1DRAFT_22746 [Syncephalis pseudoplumigaleata]|uniref:Uncharacterized protein n=1 Tax=Syncephalis pseudoplumigaleata TaxID=1712513 RepID=A0A4V1J1J4_9FUNG|nr:hypothetical protein SYNPS1DRAFT_22746 [Syncephalis pseudoplumigaleata]|eukprot:RKP25269.1 hypothetical protein SYNPS1DRAFT_22746 [Syncephalis pseudoplumigaleata]
MSNSSSLSRSGEQELQSVVASLTCASVLYCEKYVCLRSHTLTINNCYLPRSKHAVPIKDILSVDFAHDIGVPRWQQSCMGIGLNVTVWWAWDGHRLLPGKRPGYASVVIRVRGKRQRLGFTVKDGARFLPVLREAMARTQQQQQQQPTSQ